MIRRTIHSQSRTPNSLSRNPCGSLTQTKQPPGFPGRFNTLSKDALLSNFIEPDDTRYDERSRALTTVDREAIAQENPEALRAYFSQDFKFHSPGGDLDFTGLEAFFTQMRNAFSRVACALRTIKPHDIDEHSSCAMRTLRSRARYLPVG